MYGIPRSFMTPLRQALMSCDEFYSQRQLYTVFDVKDLKPWQRSLPEANSPNERVDLTISHLSGKRRASGENVLILFLKILAEKYEQSDERNMLLNTLANELTWYKQRPAKPEASMLEANPEKAKMLYIAEAEKMLDCARAVARIEVPRYVNNEKVEGKSDSGTAWLIAPGLAITCWHVMKNRGNYPTPIELSDLKAQCENTLLTFDYTTAGKGLQYSVADIVHPSPETQNFDYVILRLNDRADTPLSIRGYLQIEPNTPLKTQTSLYIIQHPLGQPQQSAGDSFVEFSATLGEILYKTPTEPGTSGAPVLNQVDWKVVALHKGENKGAPFRAGIHLKAILEDLKQQKPELYEEIMNSQQCKM